jgi:putative ABC transport system permease protein
MFMMSFRLPLLALLRSRRRTALTLGLMAVGTAALIINTGLVTFIFDGLRDDAIYGRFGHLQLYREGYISHHQSEPQRFLIPNHEYEAIASLLGRTPEVKAVMAEMDLPVFIVNGRHSSVGVAHSLSPAASMLSSSRLIAGEDQIEDHHDFVDATMGRGLAEKLEVRVGDMITVTTMSASQGYNGLDVHIAGIFEEGFRDYDDWSLKLPLGAAQNLAGRAGVERILVLLRSDSRVSDSQARILAKLQQQGFAVESTTWRELADFYRQVTAMFGRELHAIRWIIQALASLGIVISISMAFGERQREMATLLALGMTRIRLCVLFLQESFWLGLLGAALGALAGIGLAYLISCVGIPMPAPPGSTRTFIARVEVLPAVVLVSSSLTLAVTLVAGLVPAIWIWQMRIAAALRPDEG